MKDHAYIKSLYNLYDSTITCDKIIDIPDNVPIDAINKKLK